MRAAKFLAIVLPMAALLAGCSVNVNPASNTDPDCPSGVQCTNKVNGMSARDYYDQFTYKVIGSCSDRDNLSFRYFTNRDDISIGTDSWGRELFASMTLNLSSSGYYTGTYEEYYQTPMSLGMSQKHSTLERPISGSWSVSGLQIRISNLGSGSGVVLNGNPSVSMVVDSTDMSSGLRGKSFFMSRVFSTIAEHGESINQYCGSSSY